MGRKIRIYLCCWKQRNQVLKVVTAVGELFCTGTGSIWCILSIFALTLCYMFLVYSFLSFFNLNFVLLYFSSIWVSFYYDVTNKENWSWKPCLIFNECKVMYTAYGQVSLNETTDSIFPEFLFKRSLKDFLDSKLKWLP